MVAVLELAMVQMFGHFVAKTRTTARRRRFDRESTRTLVHLESTCHRFVPQRRSLLIQMTVQMKLETVRTARVVEALVTIVFSPFFYQTKNRAVKFVWLDKTI